MRFSLPDPKLANKNKRELADAPPKSKKALPTEGTDGIRKGYVWVTGRDGKLTKCQYDLNKYFCPNCDSWVDGHPKAELLGSFNELRCTVCLYMIDRIPE